jgi:ribose transport system substrate-binding protein
MLTNGDDPFADIIAEGLHDEAKELDLAARGLSVVVDKNNGTTNGQLEKLRGYAVQDDIRAVAVSVIQADNAAIAEAMKALRDRGIPVITVDSDLTAAVFPDSRSWYVGTDNLVAGRMLGRALATLLAAKGREGGGYVQFAGFTDVDNARKRMNGVKEEVGSNGRELDRMSDEMDLSRARDNVRHAIANHPDLVALVGIWAYNAPAIAEVVHERGLRDTTVVATFDAQPAAIEQMKAGRIDVMVVQNPFEMGQKTVRILDAMLRRDETLIKELFPRAGEAGGDVHATSLRVVVPAAASSVKPAVFEGMPVEFLTLADFEAWLTEKGLTGS